MQNVLIVVESEVVKKPISIGKSGDFFVINHFLQNNWNVLLTTPEMQIFYEVIKADYSSQYYEALANEVENILLKRTPDFESRNIKINLNLKIVNFLNADLLISRAMPQSLTENYLQKFNFIKKKCNKVIQNLEKICLYKDKVIPYLLQNENSDALFEFYQPIEDIDEFICEDIALKTTIVDVNESDKNILKAIEQINPPFCVKPFNLFGGIGVKIFNVYNKEEILHHKEEISKIFDDFNIKQKLILIQDAVQFPEFGDIRVLFNYGNFIGAFKKCEQSGKIHNTMYGGIISPICDANFNFSPSFEEKYHKNFLETIKNISKLNEKSDFLQNEFICGYDLLLTKKNDNFQFVLTETNIACPTGFTFLYASLIAEYFQKKPSIHEIKENFIKLLPQIKINPVCF